MWLVGVLFACFYVIYLVIVVPAAALAAAAVYGIGVPVSYLIALGRVLVVRPPGLPAPRRPPPAARGRRPRGAPVLLRSRHRRRRSGDTGRVRRLPEVLGLRRRAASGRTSAATSPGSPGRSASAARPGWPWAPRSGRSPRPAAPSSTCWPSASRPRWCGPPGPCCAAPTRPCSGSRTSGWSARTAPSGCPIPGTCARARLHRTSPRRAAGPVRHHPAPLPVRHADEDPAAVRLVADGRLLPALRPPAGASAGRGAGNRAAVLRCGRRRARPGCCSASSPSSGVDQAGAAHRRVRRLRHHPRARRRRAACCAPAAPPPRPRSSSPARMSSALSSRKGTRILHLFDAAGERFYHSDRTQELRYLGKARTFILVIDPLSVEAFWARLPAGRQAELGPAGRPPPRPSWRTSRPTRRSRRWACRCGRPGWPWSSAAPT